MKGLKNHLRKKSFVKMIIVMKGLKNHLRKKSLQKKILKEEEHRLILRKTFQHVLHHTMNYVNSLKGSYKNLEFNN